MKRLLPLLLVALTPALAADPSPMGSGATGQQQQAPQPRFIWTGVGTFGGATSFAITDTSDKTNAWLKAGDEIAGYRVSYDENKGELLLSNAKDSLRLTLLRKPIEALSDEQEKIKEDQVKDLELKLERAQNEINLLRAKLAQIPEEALRSGGMYRVKAGDTPAKLAKTFGVPVTELSSMNPQANFTKLRVGDVLYAPMAAATK